MHEFINGVAQFFVISDAAHGCSFNKLVGNVLNIIKMRPHNHSRARPDGFQKIVPANRDQATANESNPGHRQVRLEFTHDIEDKNSIRSLQARHRAEAAGLISRGLALPPDFTTSMRMPGCQD